MSAGGSGAPAEGAVDANVMLAVGIIGGLIGIYASAIEPTIGPVIACLGAVCAILWGVLAIRSVVEYVVARPDALDVNHHIRAAAKGLAALRDMGGDGDGRRAARHALHQVVDVTRSKSGIEGRACRVG